MRLTSVSKDQPSAIISVCLSDQITGIPLSKKRKRTATSSWSSRKKWKKKSIRSNKRRNIHKLSKF